jgi:hypothetical protein
MSEPSPSERQAAIRRIERFSRLMDNRVYIPGTRIGLGLDALIGVIPGIGDLLGVGLSLYILIEATRLGVPAGIRLKMLGNILLDGLVGLVPVLGDALDVAWQANQRNLKLLNDYFHPAPVSPEKPRLSFARVLVIALLLLGVAAALYFWVPAVDAWFE